MPVTRSQFKHLANQGSSLALGALPRQVPVRGLRPTAQDKTKDREISTKSVEQEQAATGDFIEWLDLDYSTYSILRRTDWKSILEGIWEEVDGFRCITWAFPMEKPRRLWIIMHWQGRTYRDKFRQSAAWTQTMTDIFLSDSETPRNYRRSLNKKPLLIYQIDPSIGWYIKDHLFDQTLPGMRYEIWMAYFPIEDIVAMSDSKPVHSYPRLVNISDQPDQAPNPMAAILEQTITWISGEVKYEGRRCKRMAWFRLWKSREAEAIYKTTVTWGKKDNGERKLASDLFIEEVKSLGMVGYETWHAQFETIQTWVYRDISGDL